MQTRVHVSFPVGDLEASIEFYRRFLGHAPTKHEDGYANFRLDSPAIHLALMESAAPTAVAHTHYGIEVMDAGDLAAWRERVEASGLPTRVEEDVTCCYARSDKFWVRDPEGREWEVWMRHADAETLGEPTEPTACCEATGCGGGSAPEPARDAARDAAHDPVHGPVHDEAGDTARTAAAPRCCE